MRRIYTGTKKHTTTKTKLNMILKCKVSKEPPPKKVFGSLFLVQTNHSKSSVLKIKEMRMTK